jgi:hypothetical protein
MIAELSSREPFGLSHQDKEAAFSENDGQTVKAQ